MQGISVFFLASWGITLVALLNPPAGAGGYEDESVLLCSHSIIFS
jgi:hypothetical protein